MFFEFGKLEPILGIRVDLNKADEEMACPFKLFVSLLQFDVTQPCVLLGLPLHPSFVDLTSSCNVPKKLFHISKLVPDMCH
jgi:hypothetical protein